MKNLAISIGILYAIAIIVMQGLNLSSVNSRKDDISGVSTQYGMPGKFLNPVDTLDTGEGSALAIDNEGKMMISTTTQVQLTTI